MRQFDFVRFCTGFADTTPRRPGAQYCMNSCCDKEPGVTQRVLGHRTTTCKSRGSDTEQGTSRLSVGDVVLEDRKHVRRSLTGDLMRVSVSRMRIVSGS